ncbi:MAG: hypothetical protein M1818_006447 [Claussenomyces sp. TS43310]|nr:MAG: hypothetical protein M1818_006447 [Claussenomyces sp. TS43310]
MAAGDRETSIEDLLRQSPSIPDRHATNAACCCGRPSCAYLIHNNTALDDLEKNIHTAAQLGQALLVRHETYMADAERTRQDMSFRIERLETDKKELEAENAKTVAENRTLLDQLEDLNSTVAHSASQVKSLEATLQSTQQELRRLEGLAARTQDLEVQLAVAEQEHLALEHATRQTEDDERSAIQRWKKAERNLYEVQEQLERMEREAREERERHIEVVGRMERQRAVEKELDTAAGRLKGAAAAASLGQSKAGSSVVSHFVKDILQDNANLQLGIVELREMLADSNDEVQTLRDQLLRHQPVDDDGEERGDEPPTLRAELTPKERQVVSQELHIHHHHYHKLKDDIRRPKKKRNVINPALFTPPKSKATSASSAAAILSQTSTTVPTPITPRQRWSIQSATTMSDFASSAPSSPQSTYRNSGLFDRGNIDQAFDSSRPTSPGSSVDPMSPAFQPHHRKRGSEMSGRSLAPSSIFPMGNVIHEEEDSDVEDLTSLHSTVNVDSTSQGERERATEDVERPRSPDDFFSPVVFEPSLRRSTSHESILSLSGLDIHTLKSRPSQMTITGSTALLGPLARQASSNPATSYVSTQPITSSSKAHARPTLSSHRGHDSSAYLRTRMGMPERAPLQSISSANDALSKRVGGWVWSRWGVSPTPSGTGKTSSSSTRAAASITAATIATVPHRAVVNDPAVVIDPSSRAFAFTGRPPGINQKGTIPGIWKAEAAPSKVTPDRVDEEALREVLLE